MGAFTIYPPKLSPQIFEFYQTRGSRTFNVSALRIWNALPEDVTINIPASA